MKLFNKIIFKLSQLISARKKLFILGHVKKLGKSVTIGNYTVIMNPEELTIGDCSQISDFTVLLSANSITIGRNCRISTSCMISSVSHKINSLNRIIDDTISAVNMQIEIGDNVWIGANTVILPGTLIGNNSIIGAGSVAKGIIPANEIWAGSPAVCIKKINYD